VEEFQNSVCGKIGRHDMQFTENEDRMRGRDGRLFALFQCNNSPNDNGII
jgi:hypothetical protein